jgi:aryl-alcohol dehydrogenase-like predicted oxidoreductase
MDYGRIAGVEKPLSRLVLGTMVCTTDNMELTSLLLDSFVAAGGNCFDLAHVYGGGKTERALGQWMKARGNRAEVILIDKGAHHNQDRRRVTPYDIAADLHDSLARLQTDYIDIYLLHRDDPSVPVGPIVEALNEHKEAGRIHAFGGSNWTASRIQEANDYAAAHGLQGFCASSPYFGLAIQNEPTWSECVALSPADHAWHKERQFPLLPWSSQASGFFTGRYSPEIRDNPDVVRVYYNETNWERLRRARELAAQKKATSNQIALAYVLHQPFPVFPLVGPRTVEELNDTLGALNVSLTPEEVRWLEA